MTNPNRLTTILQNLTTALALLFLALFTAVSLHRLRYPFELDRMESGMAASVWRLRQGLPLYSPPSLTWAPFLYAPLFFYAAAAITHLTGIGFTALRLVSIASTLSSFAFIYALTFAETRRPQPSLFAAGLFAALYPFVLAWYDVGRVDSLALVFFLAALLANRRNRVLLAALLFTLAFLTKQTFLPLGFAFFLIHWRNPRRMITGLAAYALLVAASILWLQHATHGWFRYYAFGTAGVIHWSLHTAVMFPFDDLLHPLPVACALIAAAALFTRIPWRSPDGLYLTLTTLLLAAATLYVRAHVGANRNAVIPLYAWLAVLTGIALHRLLTQTESTPTLTAALWLLALIQLAAHLYRPAEIPTGNLAARQQFLAALRSTPGDIWVTDHPFDAILANKPLHADMDALDAVLGRGYAPALAEFNALSTTHPLTAIVLDRDPAAYQPPGLFTTPPFTTTYPVRALTPGAGDLDQPLYTLLPCRTPPTPNSLTDLRNTLASRSPCPTPQAVPQPNPSR